MPDGQLPSSQAAPAKVVLRRSISAGLAGALLPLHSPLFGVGFKLVVLISHNAGATLTVSIPQSGRPDKVVRVPPGAWLVGGWGGLGSRGVGGMGGWAGW